MGKEWRSVNDLYYVKGATKTTTQAPESESTSDKKQVSSKIRLVEAKWLPGKEGFQFNKKCVAQVKGELIEKTNQLRVIINTFVEYNGAEEDLGQQVEAFLDNDGFAKADVMLYYGDSYTKALKTDPSATCKYIFRVHSNVCAKDIESEPLGMPDTRKSTVTVIEMEDVLFRHDSAVFLPDGELRESKGSVDQERITGLDTLKAILLRTSLYPDQKLLLAGHTDKSGTVECEIQKWRPEAMWWQEAFVYSNMGIVMYAKKVEE